MSRWVFWRKRPPVMADGAVPPPRRVTADFYWLGDALQVVLAWLLPSSAVVVGALGQFIPYRVACSSLCETLFKQVRMYATEYGNL